MGPRQPLPARVFAVVGFVELWLDSLFPPNLLARPMWMLLKVLVSVSKVPIHRSFRSFDRGVVAVVDNGSGHATEHGLDDVQELSARWQRSQFNDWSSVFPTVVHLVNFIHAAVKSLRPMPGGCIPREKDAQSTSVLAC